MKTVAKNTLLGSLIYTHDNSWIGIDSTCPYLGKQSEWVKKSKDKGVWQTLSTYCFGSWPPHFMGPVTLIENYVMVQMKLQD